MTFEANPDYTWGPKPSVKTITIQYAPDPTAAVQSLANGELQIINPQATEDVLKGLTALKDQGIETINGDGGTYEHVDLVFTNGGPFDPKSYGGDEDKAKAVRPGVPEDDPAAGHRRPADQAAEPGRQDCVTRTALIPGSPNYDAVVEGQRTGRRRRTVDIDGGQEDPGRRRREHLDADQGPVHVRRQQPAARQRVPADRRRRQAGRVRCHRRQERQVEFAAENIKDLRRLAVRLVSHLDRCQPDPAELPRQGRRQVGRTEQLRSVQQRRCQQVDERAERHLRSRRSSSS